MEESPYTVVCGLWWRRIATRPRLPSPPPLSLLPLRRTSVPPSKKVLLCKTKQRTDRAKRLSDTDAFGGCGFLPVCVAEPLFEWDNNTKRHSTERALSTAALA